MIAWFDWWLSRSRGSAESLLIGPINIGVTENGVEMRNQLIHVFLDACIEFLKGCLPLFAVHTAINVGASFTMKTTKGINEIVQRFADEFNMGKVKPKDFIRVRRRFIEGIYIETSFILETMDSQEQEDPKKGFYVIKDVMRLFDIF